MESYSAGDLRIDTTESDGVLVLRWTGKSSERQPREVLDPFLSKIAQRASELSLNVEMHFEDLEHFNSSTITVLIQYIEDLRKRNVSLSMCYDETLKWQKLSFAALRIFEKQDGLFSLRPKKGAA